jgi:selenide,water dikinase
MEKPPPTVADLVLIGGGHAHAHVLKMLGMKHRAFLTQHGIRITLIAKDIHTPYSGMLPGFVAGHYDHDQIHLDLNQLCHVANARLVHAAACKITYRNGGGGLVYLNDGRPPIRYDCVSIDIGSAPAYGDVVCQPGVVPVKPIANFCTAYQALVNRWENETPSSTAANDQDTTSTNGTRAEPPSPYVVAVVGGGAGGLELALSVQYRLRSINPNAPLRLLVVTRGKTILEGHNHRVQAKFQRIMQERNIEIYYLATVVKVAEDSSTMRKRLILSPEGAAVHGRDSFVVDACLWCVTAGVAPWLKADTPFATTKQGFLRVHDTYESIEHPGVFAAGDCCHVDKHPRPKAGVFAVRAGPYLLDNLLRYVSSKPLISHKPQSHFLGILATGNKYGVASKSWWLATEGSWIWTWKDYIDRTWMAKYSTDLPDLKDMMANQKHSTQQSGQQTNAFVASKGDEVLQAFTSDPMRCGGCGAKVGATIVSRVLAAVYERQIERAKLLGLPQPSRIDHDDAAVQILPNKAGGAIVQTIDYFREIVKDPFTFGKIVAVHALSDIHAMGATPQTAMTLAVAPFAADEEVTESTLLHLLSGVSDILQDENVQLVGGHTCEGLELACGLSVQGYTDNPKLLLRKQGGAIGDKIVLTKPIGTGALFAADMRARCKGSYMSEALDSMIHSNCHASQVAMRAKGIRSCTDVTGFGLIGHLLEMLMANETAKELDSIGALVNIGDIDFLRGGLEASANGIFSTLQSQNGRNRRAIVNHTEAAEKYPVKYPLLFDPQTAGGLMFFVDALSASEFLAELRAADVNAHIVGELVSYPAESNAAAGFSESVCTIGSGGAVTGKRIRVR